MKLSSALLATIVATAEAAPVMNITSIVTRGCIKTPKPLALSGVATWQQEVLTPEECLKRCLDSDTCVGALLDPSARNQCTTFTWIATAFDGANSMTSWRCGSQLPQENVQFPGLEIAKVPAASADLCSYQCEATSGCYAYSWSSVDGGSCSLKSGKPSSVTGPYDGSVLSGEVYKCGRPYFDSDLKGTDLTSAPGAQWTDCCTVCRRTSGCEGFSWSDYNGGTCWLKAKVNPNLLEPSKGVTSALMLGSKAAVGPSSCVEADTPLVFASKSEVYTLRQSESECREICLSTNCSGFSMIDDTCTVSSWIGMTVESSAGKAWRCGRQLPQENANYAGLTISTASTKDADRCSYQCDKTANCWAYSWANANNGTCVMKSSKPVTPTEPFDRSVVSGEAYKCTEPQFDWDIVGVDLASVQRPVWSDCCGVCHRTAGCEGFSWSNYNGGTCWLKTKAVRGKIKYASGVVSSYISTPKTTCQITRKRFVGKRKSWALKSREECERLCLFTNCVGYQWTSRVNEPSECEIFSWITRLREPLDDSTSLFVRCRAQLLQENGDYPGADIKNVRTADAALCSYECEDTPTCFAYTWANGVCYMKSAKPSQVSGPSDGSVISGEPFRAGTIVEDYDIVGHDLGSVKRDTWPECVGVCRRTSGCFNVVWSSYNGGTCWLKGDNITLDTKKNAGSVWVSLT